MENVTYSFFFTRSTLPLYHIIAKKTKVLSIKKSEKDK